MFVTLLVVLIILIIIVLISWGIKRHNRNKKPVEVEWPPNNYMKNIGSKCPDYWTYLGDYGDNTFCQNNFNLTFADAKEDECQDKKKIVNFPKITSWPPNKKQLQKRCRWMKGCGNTSNTDASWIGMDKLCSKYM